MNTYHRLDDPLNPAPLPPKYSSLQTLYPGVPMPRTDDYNMYNIPHEDPEAAKQSFIDKRKDTIDYGRKLESMSRGLAENPGGKVTIHAVDDPSMPNEDPDLSQASVQSPIAFNDGMEFGAPGLMDDETLVPKARPRTSQISTTPISRDNYGAVELSSKSTDSGLDDNIIYMLALVGALILIYVLYRAWFRRR